MLLNSRHRFALFCACLLAALLLSGCAAEMSHREGMRAMDNNEYVEAVNKLAKASELKPRNPTYRKDWLRARDQATVKLLALAATGMADGNPADAVRHYQAILQYARDNARALAGLEQVNQAANANVEGAQARAAFKRGDIGQASELAARALKNSPNQAEARAVNRDIAAQLAQDMLITPSLGAMYKKPINLEFRDASIKMVFDALSRTTGINFIFDRDVKAEQRTTVFLKQTTLDDAIDVILSTGQMDKKILNASSVLIYPATSAKHREYEDLIVKAFYLANVEAKQSAAMLKTVLKLKDVYVDEKTNMLILRENPETIALAAKLITLQDLEEPEVMLEVEVLEINRTRLLNLGIDLPNQLTIAPLGTSISTSPTTGNTSTNFKLDDLKSLSSSRLGVTVPSATINLQKLDGDANLLANPRIRVRDNEKAKILIGDKVPVVTTTSNGTFVTENIQYLDVGLKLEVEADIHLRDEIGLKLSLEVSSLVSSIKTNNGSTAYQIGTRNFTSALRLKDGETQVLAGLISDEDRSAASRVPLLGELPLLGRLFSSQNDNRKKTELVLSITPRLIRNIQRKDAAAESFWSGTEATLRNKPLQLRTVEPAAGVGAGAPSRAASAPVAPAATDARAVVPVAVGGSTQPVPPSSGAPTMAWSGPSAGKVGQVLSLSLSMDSVDALRAMSLQLAFNPAEIEILTVQGDDFFSKNGKGSFSQSIDVAGGRISVGAGAGDAAGAKGAGRLLTVTFKPKAAAKGASTGISVIGMTPIGAQRAVGRPGSPLVHTVQVGP